MPYTKIQFDKTIEWIERMIRIAIQNNEDYVEYTVNKKYDDLIQSVIEHYEKELYEVELIDYNRSYKIHIRWKLM